MTGTRPRVLLVSARPPPVGGIATWTETVLNSDLAERFALEPFDTAPRDATDRPSDSRFRFGRAVRSVALVQRFRAALTRQRPAVVHVCTSYHWALARDGLFVRLARRAGARTLLHLHGGDVAEFVTGCSAPVRAAVVATLRRADRVIAVTPAAAAFLRETLESARVRYLPNFAPIEPSDFAPGEGGPRAEGPLEVLFVGAVIEAKGVLDLLTAAESLPGVRFTLAGPVDESLAATLRARAARLGPRVQLLGAVDRATVATLLRRADVFVLPSHREGLPLALLEAMAAGLACVATGVGGVPEVARAGMEALIVPPRDPAALVLALRSLCDSADLRRSLGERARHRVVEAFGRDAGLAQLRELWQELLAGA